MPVKTKKNSANRARASSFSSFINDDSLLYDVNFFQPKVMIRFLLVLDPRQHMDDWGSVSSIKSCPWCVGIVIFVDKQESRHDSV